MLKNTFYCTTKGTIVCSLISEKQTLNCFSSFFPFHSCILKADSVLYFYHNNKLFHVTVCTIVANRDLHHCDDDGLV